MKRKLSEMHGNTIVLVDRIELANFFNKLDKKDSRLELAMKIFLRTAEKEVSTGKVFMDIPIRVSELKKLYPDYMKNQPNWYERKK